MPYRPTPRRHMLAAVRLDRLRQIASTTTTSDYGRDHIQRLLDQETAASDVQCPRWVALAEHAGDRRLVCGDDPGALVLELQAWSVDEVPHRAEAIIDLENGTRYAAASSTIVTFTPPLPDGGEERLVAMNHGHCGALKLAARILETHGEERQDGESEDEAAAHAEYTAAAHELGDLLDRWRVRRAAA
jgi:hypothetical protein